MIYNLKRTAANNKHYNDSRSVVVNYNHNTFIVQSKECITAVKSFTGQARQLENLPI
jgi:hypothetical protein